MAAIPIAGILGNPLSGWIMDAFDQFAGMQGWQWMFLVEAVPAVLLGILVLFFLCEASFLKDVTQNNRTGMYMLAGMLVLGALLVLKIRPEDVNR
jgi:MFS family permease